MNLTKLCNREYNLDVLVCKQVNESSFELRKILVSFVDVSLKNHADINAGRQTHLNWNE